jgi:hypothetical protein
MNNIKKGLNNKLAGQIGEYLVCAELGKRGYIATSFAGNVPEFDLIVANDNLKTIPIQVKTSRGHSWPTRGDLWIDIEIDEKNKIQIDHGNQTISNPDLIYICVALSGPDSQEKDRFFILHKNQMQIICAANYRAWMLRHNWKRPRNYKSIDNRYYIKNLLDFENNWKVIEDALHKQGTG